MSLPSICLQMIRLAERVNVIIEYVYLKRIYIMLTIVIIRLSVHVYECKKDDFRMNKLLYSLLYSSRRSYL